jgi:hypothetical protein
VLDICDNYDNVPLFTKETVTAAAYHTEEADSGPTLRQLLVSATLLTFHLIRKAFPSEFKAWAAPKQAQDRDSTIGARQHSTVFGNSQLKKGTD